MQTSLKRAIVDYIFENLDNFQAHNATVEEFRTYIYDHTGNYLEHGGKEVSEFINQAIGLIRG